MRTCQVYHIDLPWEPATLQQRNGRAVRQGQHAGGHPHLLPALGAEHGRGRFSMILGKLNWMKDII